MPEGDPRAGGESYPAPGGSRASRLLRLACRLTGDGVAVASVLAAGVVIAAYVHHSMGQVRQSLPREILEQQHEMTAISHSLGRLVHALDMARRLAGPDAVRDSRVALEQTLTLLGGVRRHYSFDSLTGVSAVHALVNPAVQDVERWLREGVPGRAPDSPVVLALAHRRAHEAYEEARALNAQTAALARSLLGAEVERLNRVRGSLMAFILAFAVLAVGVVALYVRQRNVKERFAVAQGRLTDSLESVGQAVALFDAEDRLVLCNRRYRELFGVESGRSAPRPTLAEVMARALGQRRILGIGGEGADPDEAYRGARREPGRSFELEWSDGRHFQATEHPTHEGGTICFLTDITDLKVAQRRLEHLATHDALTGLPSRRRFARALDEALHRARRHGGQVAVMFVDIDRLKWINDTYGHLAGDRFLQEFALRMRGTLREHDVVARLGGDEFAVILGDLEGWQQAAASAERALDTLSAPIRLDGIEIRTTISMGIAIHPTDGEDAAVLLKKADDACYHAKSSGRANFQFYTERINEQTARRAAVEDRLRAALRDGTLAVHYQPQLSLEERRITGLEALLRWDDAELGAVEPDEFVPVAEDSGLGRMLLDHAAAEVCRELGRWRLHGVPACRVWLNVSPRQLADALPALEAAGARHGVALDALGIEITERTLVAEPVRTRKVLAEIRARGVRLAIDDFGVGYSSLSALKDYPLDELKIDASFVRNLATGGQDLEIVRAIVALARSLGLAVVAEGVETAAQASLLLAQGVETVQGNLVSAAVPGEQAGALLRAGAISLSPA